MKTIEETLLNRTSVRRYEYDKIPSETLDFIYRAIANTPTSYNGQQFSVIAIDDQSIKEELYAITNQKQIKTCATLLVFCADYHKIDILAQKKRIDNPHFENTLDGVMVGIIDAALAMQNAVVAAQAAGLGSCCVGYARENSRNSKITRRYVCRLCTHIGHTQRITRRKAQTTAIISHTPQSLPY